MSQWFHQGRFLSGWPDVQLGVEGRGGARGLQSPRVGQYHLGARHLRNRPFSTREIHGAAKSPGINIKSLKKGTDIYIIYISIYIYIYIHTYILYIYTYYIYIDGFPSVGWPASGESSGIASRIAQKLTAYCVVTRILWEAQRSAHWTNWSPILRIITMYSYV